MAFDAFLQLVQTNGQQIQGETTDAAHPNEIEVSGYNFAATHPVTQGSATGGAGAGKVTFQDFSFSTPTSKVTPLLLQACAGGTHFSKAVLSLRRVSPKDPRGGGEFLKITMQPVFVSQFSTGGATGDDAPHDEVRLSFGSVHFAYTPQNPNGSTGTPTQGGWDVTKNAPA